MIKNKYNYFLQFEAMLIILFLWLFNNFCLLLYRVIFLMIGWTNNNNPDRAMKKPAR